MTKKVKNAQERAGVQPEAERDVQPNGGAEPQAPALVEGDGAAASGRAEHAGGSPAAAPGADGPGLVDAEVPYGAAAAATVPPAGEDGDLEEARRGLTTPADMGDGSALGPETNDDDVDPADPERRFAAALRADPAFAAAYRAMDEAAAYALREAGDGETETWSLDHLLTLDGMAVHEAAACLREIGHARATVDVVATHLRLKGHLAEAKIDGPQRVLLEIFLFTLSALEGFARGEADRRAESEAASRRRPPAPVPLDETTLEPVDEPFATY